MDCSKLIVTASLETGPSYVLIVAGRVEPWTLSGCGRKKGPLTRWPGFCVLVSLAVSVASPAVEITLAVVLAVYVRATPGTNAPKLAGVPSVSESVAGTLPPTGTSWRKQ